MATVAGFIVELPWSDLSWLNGKLKAQFGIFEII